MAQFVKGIVPKGIARSDGRASVPWEESVTWNPGREEVSNAFKDNFVPDIPLFGGCEKNIHPVCHMV